MGAKSDFTCLGGFPGALVQEAFEPAVLPSVTKEFRAARTGLVRSNIPVKPRRERGLSEAAALRSGGSGAMQHVVAAPHHGKTRTIASAGQR